MDINIFWKCSLQLDPTLICLETGDLPSPSPVRTPRHIHLGGLVHSVGVGL